MTYFEEVARVGGPLPDPLIEIPSIDLMRGFSKAATLTVWRPTSTDAISKMMKGFAAGKGLDVKGKSAKTGKLSGLVPFLQIDNNAHKNKVAWSSFDAWARIYFKTVEQRNVAKNALVTCASEMKLKNKAAIKPTVKLRLLWKKWLGKILTIN